MHIDSLFERLMKHVRPTVVISAAVVLLGALWVVPTWLQEIEKSELEFQKHLHHVLEQSMTAKERIGSNETIRGLDLEQLKAGLSGTAQSQKSLFETGLSLQEERRLLEKQLEIVTTSLLVNPALQRVFLMRAEQPLQSYLISYIPLKAFGGVQAALPNAARITSKERFAHPERGKSEQVDGQLQWTPPQVGTSVRSKALGEFVMFTSSPLIFHGTPVSEEDHARFPHVCLGLDTEAARRLYRGSFIGTRVTLSNISVEAVPVPADLTLGTTPQ